MITDNKALDWTMLTLISISCILIIGIAVSYEYFPEGSIMQKLGKRPPVNEMTKSYVESNINAISNDVRIYMSFQIPATAQIDSERMNELIQDNVKFQYAAPQIISRKNRIYETTATAHIKIRVNEAATGPGDIIGALPFTFIVDRQNYQVTEYYVQHEEAYFRSNLTQPGITSEKTSYR